MPEEAFVPDHPDLLLGLVQELRTPLTSMVGYLDLLIGESAGILGQMQKSFLQRVSANVNRLQMMIDDLVQVTRLDTGDYQLTAQAVDLVNIIETAITDSSVQFREKGLVVDLEIEANLPPLHADKDALTQIIGQLITNAYLVSPPDSAIVISAIRQFVDLSQNGVEKQTDCIQVSVRDYGGGILTEDIPRVFSRKYKAENPLIAGLGDTGVGLSVAKALVEAHAGKLWVETEEGIGSTFMFVLPFNMVTEVGN